MSGVARSDGTGRAGNAGTSPRIPGLEDNKDQDVKLKVVFAAALVFAAGAGSVAVAVPAEAQA